MTLINHRSNGRHEADISIPRHLERDGINIVGGATSPAEALRQTTYAATDFAEILDASPRRHCHFWVI
jgi:hypothetical protein